jgi:hypothetical protein
MMLAQIGVKRVRAGFGQKILEHHVLAATFRVRSEPMRVLPCFLSMRPVVSRCLPSKPFLAI